MKCPKCSYLRDSSDPSDIECPKCGVIYAKAVPRQSDLLRPSSAVLRNTDQSRDSGLPYSVRPAAHSEMVQSQTGRLFYIVAILCILGGLILAFTSHSNLKQTTLREFAGEAAAFWVTVGLLQSLFLVAIGKGLTYLKNIELSVRSVASREE